LHPVPSSSQTQGNPLIVATAFRNVQGEEGMLKKFYLIPIIFIVFLMTGLTAFADAPKQSHLHIQLDFGYRWVCDSNGSGVVDDNDTHLEVRYWENINLVTDYDANGNEIRYTFRQSNHSETYNVATGELLFTRRFTGQDSYDVLTDAYTISGGTQHLYVRSDGTLFHEAGRVSFNTTTGEVLYESGQHSSVNPGYQLSDCDALNAGEAIAWEFLYENVIVLGPR
jgi:hypothetical protein